MSQLGREPHNEHAETIQRMRDLGSPTNNPPERRSIFLEAFVTSDEKTPELVRDWFVDCFELIGSNLGELLREFPPKTAYPARRMPDDADRPWGNVRLSRASGETSKPKAFSEAVWQAFTDEIANGLVHRAEFNAGVIDDRGIAEGAPQIMILGENLEGGLTRLVAMFESAALYDFDFVNEFVAFLDTFGTDHKPLLGLVDYTFGGTRHEESEGLVENDNLHSMKSKLRGFGWITLIPETIGEAMGGATGIMRSRAFYSIRHLEHGGYLLQATRRFVDFDANARSEIGRQLGPNLVRRVLPNRSPS